RVAHNYSIHTGGISGAKYGPEVSRFLDRFKHYDQWIVGHPQIRQTMCRLFRNCDEASGIFSHGNLVVHLFCYREQSFFGNAEVAYFLHTNKTLAKEKIADTVTSLKRQRNFSLPFNYKQTLPATLPGLLKGEQSFDLGVVMTGDQCVHRGYLVEFYR